jgi:hypothetical protein
VRHLHLDAPGLGRRFPLHHRIPYSAPTVTTLRLSFLGSKVVGGR